MHLVSRTERELARVRREWGEGVVSTGNYSKQEDRRELTLGSFREGGSFRGGLWSVLYGVLSMLVVERALKDKSLRIQMGRNRGWSSQMRE